MSELATHSNEIERIKQEYARRARTDFGDRYSIFNPAQLFITQEIERAMLGALQRCDCNPLGQREILDVGCGIGHWLRRFILWGADPARVCGIELDPARADAARRTCPAEVRILNQDATVMAFPNASFDVVLQSTVFTSILDDAVRRSLAAEMRRVTKPGGVILWYDFCYNNPRNPAVRGVPPGEVRRLFPDCAIRLRRLTLAPPLARRLAPISRGAMMLFNFVPWLRTHALAVIRPRK